MGWLSGSNGYPREGLGLAGRGVGLVEKSFYHAVFSSQHAFGLRMYLGCISNADGTVVYWVNPDNPLP